MQRENKVSLERIEILFGQAEKYYKKYPFLAHRYMFLARKISSKTRTQIPRELRRRFCHRCYHYLYPGQNLKVRINKKNKAVEYLCLDCKRVNRYPYVREKLYSKR